MAFLRTIFGFIVAVALIGVAVSNRQITTLVYSPIHEPLEVPLYLITLIFLAAGFVFGGLLVWMNSAPTRKVKRQQRKTIKTLEKEISTLQTKSSNDPAPDSEFFPALPVPEKGSKNAV